MKIGILGSGEVGQALALGFLNEGHDVMLGTRNVSKDEVIKFRQANPAIRTRTFEETANSGELLVIAVAGSVAEEVIQVAGKANFKDKTVIDVSNPAAAAPPVNGVLHFFTSLEESLIERIQRTIPEAKVVKAFNSVGSAFMYKPDFKGEKPTMFICGNDEGAKEQVTEILDAFGWETSDMGKVEAGRAIEPLSMLWCIPGFLRNEWSHAFKLLKT